MKAPERTYYTVQYGIQQDPWQESKSFQTEKDARAFYAEKLSDPANHSKHVMRLTRCVETTLIDGQFDYTTNKPAKGK
jgi:hypothetical protein